ncbi:sucrose-proton symporter 7 [Striga asiatica]|uniref:Sucrose-proton symporter 7 n=1 Tax=Striga asiatica TaxID=4170 RepID=A0A5A7R097_STRAF|nr:sucrose-proton symporter 7 [Striga asiatica]
MQNGSPGPVTRWPLWIPFLIKLNLDFFRPSKNGFEPSDVPYGSFEALKQYCASRVCCCFLNSCINSVVMGIVSVASSGIRVTAKGSLKKLYSALGAVLSPVYTLPVGHDEIELEGQLTCLGPTPPPMRHQVFRVIKQFFHAAFTMNTSPSMDS